jgi:phosphatidate cytidylyltransferase
MSNNFLKRTITSIILLAILLIVNYSHHFVFMISIAIVGGVVCVEASDISSKLVGPLFMKHNKKDSFTLKINYKYLLISVVVFIYIFFIFGQYSYEVYRLESPTFFLYLVSICFLTDIGGYVFGKTIGGRKLTKISPNKTISGTIGSFVFSILPLIVFSNLSIIDLEFTLKNIIFVLLVSLVSQLGDLFISYFKRKAKIKDTGKILPGHGGALDRVDGVVFALPFSYFLLKFI